MPYHVAKIPYLVIPFLQRRRAVSLKAFPLADTRELLGRGLPAQLRTGQQEPCLLNESILNKTDEVLIFTRELHAIAVAGLGYPVVSCGSLSRFLPQWATLFEGKRVALVLEEKKAGDERIPQLQDLFNDQGVEPPSLIIRPKGQDWATMLREQWGEAAEPQVVFEEEDDEEAPTQAQEDPGSSAVRVGVIPESVDEIPEPPSSGALLPPRGNGQAKGSARSTAPMPPPPPPPPVAGHLVTVASSKFIASVSLDRGRTLVITRLTDSEGKFVRMQVWQKSSPASKNWKPDEKNVLVIPFTAVKDLISGAAASLLGQQSDEPPEWYTPELESEFTDDESGA